MKRTVNFKALLILVGIIATLVILYFADYWMPDSFKITQSTTLYNTMIGRLVDGFVEVCFGLMGICILILLGIGTRHLFNWIFPKNSSPDKPNRDGE